MNFKQAQELLLNNDAYSKAYTDMIVSFDIARSVIEARNNKSLTQKQLAELVKTGQSSIARLESGESLPSLSFLNKIAAALDMILLPPLLVSRDKINYYVSSNVDTQNIISYMIESRKSMVTNPTNTIQKSTKSGTFYTSITEVL